MAGVTTGELECPVCNDYFTNPKLLQCNHTVCRACVHSWLQKGGGQAGCPLCRAPILSSTQRGQGQLSALVDALPTDWVMTALVESHKLLNGPHVCDVCPNNVTATSYCFACHVKLCTTCSTHHQRLPVSRDHNLEQLIMLTVQRLAANRQTTCNSHTNRPAELYCPAHQELICMLCDSTNHRSCAEVKVITEVAREKRTELTQQSQRLKEKGAALAALTKQLQTAKDRFMVTRRKAKGVFDDLQQCLDKRRQQVDDIIQAEEDATMMSLAEIEKVRAAITSHFGKVDLLVTSAPDDALLQMLKQLKSRLEDLESESGRTAKVKDVGDLVLDRQLVTRLKSDLSQLGEIQKPHQQASASPVATVPSATPTSGPAATAKPRGAELARVLKVGDRVRRGPNWFHGNQDWGGPGTVTAIPSRIVGGTGWVDVCWDRGFEGWYRMGYGGHYELDLA